MKTYFKLLIVILVLTAGISSALAELTLADLKSNQMLIESKGIVCAFCVYGAEKKLKTLEYVDKSQLNKGVSADIKSGVIILALDPSKPFNLAKAYSLMKDGSYEMTKAHLKLKGTIQKEGNQTLLVMPSGQKFELS